MNTAPFRYGFHPAGVDPLAALRAPRTTQASTVACGPSPNALPAPYCQAGTPVGRKPLAVHVPKAPSVARRGGSWGAVLWIAAVSASMGIGGLVWAFDQGEAGSEPEPLAMAIAAPTILEPDPLPAPESDVALPEALAPVSQAPVSRAPEAASKPSVPSVTAPSTAEPPVLATPPVSPPVTPPPVAASPTPSVEPTAPVRPTPPRVVPVVVAKADPPLMAPVRIPRADLLQPKPPKESQPASPKLRVPAMSTKSDGVASGRIGSLRR